MPSGILKIAACQFAVGSSIKRNAAQITAFMRKANRKGADIVHFPESALTGYVGVDFPNFDNYNWLLLRLETEKIICLAILENNFPERLKVLPSLTLGSAGNSSEGNV